MSEQKALNIDSTPLWQDVKATILSKGKAVNCDISIQIHTSKGDFTALKILELEEMNDYVKDIAGHIHIRFLLPLGDYVYKLYPYRDLFEVSIKQKPQTETNDYDETAETSVLRYRGVLNLKENPKITSDRVSDIDYDTLNTMAPVEVTLELIDRNQEVLRVATVPGATYPEVTMKQLISGLMVGESNKYKVDGEPVIQGFNLVEPDNSAILPYCHVPNMKIGLIPTFLQEHGLGVYSSAIGTHYQRKSGIPSWYVYPLYKTSRFDEDVERLVIFAIPEDRMSGMDVTFRKEGKITYIIATGQRNYQDDSQISDLNQGVGFRIPSATGVFNGGADMTPDGPVADRARLNIEVGGRPRGDGVYYAPLIPPTDNPFKYYGNIARSQISQLSVVWENSDPDLIYPGMPCKYVFMDKNEYRELKGIVLGRYSVTNLIGAPSTSNTYRRSTNLGICLEYFDDIDTPYPTTPSPGTF